MPIGLAIFLFFIFFVIAMVILAVSSDSYKGITPIPTAFAGFFGTAGIVFLGWAITAGCQQKVVDKEIIHDVVTLGNFQYIQFKDGGTLNVNAHFGRQFAPGDKVKRIIYKQSYCGIVWEPYIKSDYSVIPQAEKIELSKKSF